MLFNPKKLLIIAGPCSVENRKQAFEVAAAVKKSGAQFFRGGAIFKILLAPGVQAGFEHRELSG